MSIVIAIAAAELALANTTHGYLIVITTGKTMDLSGEIWRFILCNVYFRTREDDKKKYKTHCMITEKYRIVGKRDTKGVEDRKRGKVRGFLEDIGLIRPKVSESRLD